MRGYGQGCAAKVAVEVEGMSNIATLPDTDEQPTQPDKAQPAPSQKKRAATAPKPARPRKGITASDVRAVLRKQQELEAASDNQRTMLASALGKPGATTEDLTVLILTSPRIDLGAVADLTEIGDKDGAVKRAIAAMQLTADRPRAKAVWHLLVSLGVVSGNAPGSDGDLAEGIATALDALTEEHAHQLDTVRELAAR